MCRSLCACSHLRRWRCCWRETVPPTVHRTQKKKRFVAKVSSAVVCLQDNGTNERLSELKHTYKGRWIVFSVSKLGEHISGSATRDWVSGAAEVLQSNNTQGLVRCYITIFTGVSPLSGRTLYHSWSSYFSPFSFPLFRAERLAMFSTSTTERLSSVEVHPHDRESTWSGKLTKVPESFHRLFSFQKSECVQRREEKSRLSSRLLIL